MTNPELRFPTEEEWAVKMAVNMYDMDEDVPDEEKLSQAREHIAVCDDCRQILAGKYEEYWQW